eukprot:maker-scaffold1595_size34508-snap-gene-0.9 protein:Tk09500 transcript:maker-scaffold1595_size34508-snap-gene-0.9-mRNA-1 annotation:"mitogen-activated protein kinase kinase kinase 1-like"
MDPICDVERSTRPMSLKLDPCYEIKRSPETRTNSPQGDLDPIQGSTENPMEHGQGKRALKKRGGTRERSRESTPTVGFLARSTGLISPMASRKIRIMDQPRPEMFHEPIQDQSLRSPSPDKVEPTRNNESSGILQTRTRSEGAEEKDKIWATSKFCCQRVEFDKFSVQAGVDQQLQCIHIGPQVGYLMDLFDTTRLHQIYQKPPETRDTNLLHGTYCENEWDFESWLAKHPGGASENQSTDQQSNGPHQPTWCWACFKDISENDVEGTQEELRSVSMGLRLSCCGTRIHGNCYLQIERLTEPGSLCMCPSCYMLWDPHSPSQLSSCKKTLSSALWETDPFPNRSGYGMLLNPETITLPNIEAIEQNDWSMAHSWISVLGRDMVACLMAKDWIIRETALRRLSQEMTTIPQGELSDRFYKCGIEMLAKMMTDKVFKVYVSALQCFRVFLSCVALKPSQVIHFKPIIQGIILKCADGNKRVAELSSSVLIAIATQDSASGGLSISTSSAREDPEGSLGLDLILQVIAEARDPQQMPSWNHTLGRLTALEKLLIELPLRFSIQGIAQLPSHHLAASDKSRLYLEQRLQANYLRLMMAVNLSSTHLESKHSLVIKASRDIFVASARLAACNENVFREVCLRISGLEPTVQIRLRKRLLAMAAHKDGPIKNEQYLLLDKLMAKEIYERTKSYSPSKWTINAGTLHRSQPYCANRRESIKNASRSNSQSPSRRLWSPFQNPSRTHSQSPARWRTSASARTPGIRASVPSLIGARGVDATNSGRVWVQSGTPASFGGGECIGEQQQYPSAPVVFNHDESSSPMEGEGWPSGRHWDNDRGSASHVPHPRVSEELTLSSLFDTPLPLIPRLLHQSSEEEFGPLSSEVPNQVVGSNYVEGHHWSRGTLLGSGAFSSCFLARDKDTGTIMAVKQINLGSNAREEQLQTQQMIRDEIHLLSRIHHPHVVRFFGATSDQIRVNLFMEWMPGGSVSSLLRQHGTFHEVVIRRYALQILLGLEYLHAFGILHRDLKGANLLVDSSGAHLRIADFGAASRLVPTVDSTTSYPDGLASELGGDGQLQGTIAFMAPEVLRGESCGPTCDIWSLGCCIIEMTTCQPPWNACEISNHLALIFKIARSPNPPQIPSTLSPGLQDLTQLCLQPDPRHRPNAESLLFHPIFEQHGCFIQPVSNMNDPMPTFDWNSATPFPSTYQCSGATDEELELYYMINWWTEGVLQVLISVVGICGNFVSMWIMSSGRMQSVFNRLLIFLALFDNLYLILSILDSIRHEHGTLNIHYHLFANVLYPMHNASLTCSIYMTVVLAFERYLAVAHPVSYHLSVNDGRQWARITRYVLPVVIFSTLFNIPKFFELRAEEVESHSSLELSNGTWFNQTHSTVRIQPTRLRLDQDYIFYYQNNARLLITGIIPFLALLGLNYGIYEAVARRKHIFGGLQSSRGGGNSIVQQHAAEENRQALMLFAIVIFFLLFNIPRNFLSLNEFISLKQVKEDYLRGCKGLALWILLVGTLSHFFLVVNSSMNFFLYCGMSKSFREQLKLQLCPKMCTQSCLDSQRRGEIPGLEGLPAPAAMNTTAL